MLPNDFPPWQTVYWWFRRFVRRLLFRTIHDVALMLDREREIREQCPSAAVVDSQSIKAPAAEKRGFDAGKKIVGRKRHIAVDTDGRLLMVNLTTADISDPAGVAPAVFVSRPETVAPALLWNVPAFATAPVQVRLLLIVPAFEATLPVQTPLLVIVPVLVATLAT